MNPPSLVCVCSEVAEEISISDLLIVIIIVYFLLCFVEITLLRCCFDWVECHGRSCEVV